MVAKHIIIYTFHSLEDPLVKGLVLDYLKGLSEKEDNYHFHLITHEQKEFALSAADAENKKKELTLSNITWYPVKYRSGLFLLIKKIYNFLQTFFIVLSVKRKHQPVAIMGFLSISGGYSYILSKLLRLKLIVYCFEPHSAYMLDFKIWNKNSLKYSLLHYFEQQQLKHATYIVVPNHYTKELALTLNQKAEIRVFPISIDTNLMVFDPQARQEIRKKLNATDRRVIIYTGKFGGIYYSTDEVVKFFSQLYAADNKLFFYIISPNIREIEASIGKYELPLNAYSLSDAVNYNELNRHISAADIGFVALPDLPSQKYRTPVKTAIYLSCGIPYIVNKNIADDDLVALKENIGVVINNLAENPVEIQNRIDLLLKEDPGTLRSRCRNYAINKRSNSKASQLLRSIFVKL